MRRSPEKDRSRLMKRDAETGGREKKTKRPKGEKSCMNR